MPPLALMPYQPPGSPDITSYGYGGGMGPASSSSSFDDEYFRRMDAYIAQVQAAMAASAGWEREKFRRQLEDAVEARKQARELAMLQDQTQRYGIDVGSRDRMAQLAETVRQFDLNHGLEVQKLGLDRARTATDYMATPDRWAQAGNYLALSGRVLADQDGAGTYGSAVQPRPNTESDFAVLASGGNPNAGRGSAVEAATSGGGGGAGADMRQKALKAVISDYQPSNGVGLDENDYAVLNASRAIMNMNLTPKQQQTINSNPEYRAILGSNLKNLGQNPDAWFKSQRQTLPGQQSARYA
jgi:hypothetical protein